MTSNGYQEQIMPVIIDKSAILASRHIRVLGLALMRVMFLAEAPAFDEILDQLSVLEHEINKM